MSLEGHLASSTGFLRRNIGSRCLVLMAWVYILECSDGSYYVGSARDLDQRLHEHAQGLGSRHTAKQSPVRLAWAQEVESVDEAWALERRLHGWSHAKKKALIDGRWGDLRQLSRRRAGRPRKEGPGPSRPLRGTSGT